MFKFFIQFLCIAAGVAAAFYATGNLNLRRLNPKLIGYIAAGIAGGLLIGTVVAGIASKLIVGLLVLSIPASIFALVYWGDRQQISRGES